MPIYTYQVVDTGAKFEVVQEPDAAPHAYAEEVDGDTVVAGQVPWGHLAIIRVTSAPGLFIGLPTPKFYGNTP